MKQLIIIIVLGISGYFAYHYFIESSQQASHSEGTQSNGNITYSGPTPQIPSECETKGKALESAIYGNNLGRTSFAKRNHARYSFESCLQNAGFTDSQISETIAAIEESVKKLNPGSASGF